MPMDILNTLKKQIIKTNRLKKISFNFYLGTK